MLKKNGVVMKEDLTTERLKIAKEASDKPGLNMLPDCAHVKPSIYSSSSSSCLISFQKVGYDHGDNSYF